MIMEEPISQISPLKSSSSKGGQNGSRTRHWPNVVGDRRKALYLTDHSRAKSPVRPKVMLAPLSRTGRPIPVKYAPADVVYDCYGDPVPKQIRRAGSLRTKPKVALAPLSRTRRSIPVKYALRDAVWDCYGDPVSVEAQRGTTDRPCQG